jgi:hypothetical protein
MQRNYQVLFVDWLLPADATDLRVERFDRLGSHVYGHNNCWHLWL